MAFFFISITLLNTLFIKKYLSATDFRNRLRAADVSHRFMRHNMDNLKPVQLQLDSPKYRKLKHEMQKQEQARGFRLKSLGNASNFTGTASSHELN